MISNDAIEENETYAEEAATGLQENENLAEDAALENSAPLEVVVLEVSNMAEQVANVGEGIGVTTAEVVLDNTAGEENGVATDFTCELCEVRFNKKRGLRTHEGQLHTANSDSTIPQLDGQNEHMGNDMTYCFISEYGQYDIEYTLKTSKQS